MRQIIRRSLLLCSFATLTLPASAQMQMQMAAGTLAFSIDLTEGVQAFGVEVDWAEDGRLWRGTADRGLSIEIEQRPVTGDAIVLDVTIGNAGEQRRLLQFAALLAPELDEASAQYWDGGFRAVRPIPGPQETDEPRERGAWPLSAAGDATRAIFVGITPDTLISFAEPTFDYVPGGASDYRFSVRTVLDPGAEERFGVVVGTTGDVRWGFLRAVWQAYRDAFEEHFTVADAVPDAVWGTSSQYHAWWPGIDHEELRRLGCTWEWCYAPFKRSGDFWGRDDEWEYESLAKPFSERLRGILGGSYDMGEISAEQFREEREAFFAEYGYDTGALFYTPAGIWVEEQLAEEKFADAIVQNDREKTRLSAWVTGYDDELLVQPTGTSYGERLEEDYRLVGQNLEITGYAFDVAVAGQRNYAEVVRENPLPGRSWDERGVFFDLGISMVEQYRYLRGLDWSHAPFERPLIVGAGTSFTAWHVDGALMELTLTGPQRHKWASMCMALGGKPGVIWKGYELRDVLQDPDGMPRGDFLNVWAKLADYVMLKSFEWGMFPGYNYLPGMDKLQRDFPLLRECVRAGWQPVCPVEHAGDDTLWMGRYGGEAGVLIAVGNPAEELVAADLKVHNDALGESNCVFVNARTPTAPIAQTLDDRTTRLSIDAPGRRVSVLRSVLGIRADGPLECVASAQEDLDRMVTRVSITADVATEATLAIPERRGFDVDGVALGGAPCGEAVVLPAGESVVEITYSSRHFDFGTTALDGVEFLTEEGEMAFSVDAPEPEERAYARVCGHLDRYFRYHARHELGREEIEPLSVVDGGGTDAAIVLRIGQGAEGNGWSLRDGALVLNAPDEEQAMLRTKEFLEALDRRFEHIVPFRPVYGMAGHHLTARGLHGLTMTEALAQEGQRW
ncbi:MAG: hypothetical protein ACOX9R_02235 [Armatimonadota bacterium]|jgi:hypothetical protein